jgi:1-acyl-sn-glycerol-3-phosphate acyltransferase
MNRLYTLILLPLRVVAVLLLTLLGLSVQLALFWCVSRSLARAIVKFWSLGMLYCLGVKTIVSSDPGVVNTGVDVPQNQAALYVCNHVSWLDILAVQATAPVVFVAKSEIRSWPVLGWMVSLAGTCFIHRERRTALRGVHSALTALLQSRQSVCIFPEGTTSDGSEVGVFHAGLLQAAIEAGVCVQPLRLDYSSQAAAYIGEMSLLKSLSNVLLTPSLKVQVLMLSRIDSQGNTRQALALRAQRAIAQARV